MAPFYELEPTRKSRRLAVGETVRVSTGPKKARVEIRSKIEARVIPDENSWVYVGKVDRKNGQFREMPRVIREQVDIEKESVASNIGTPKVVWRKK